MLFTKRKARGRKEKYNDILCHFIVLYNDKVSNDKSTTNIYVSYYILQSKVITKMSTFFYL